MQDSIRTVLPVRALGRNSGSAPNLAGTKAVVWPEELLAVAEQQTHERKPLMKTAQAHPVSVSAGIRQSAPEGRWPEAVSSFASKNGVLDVLQPLLDSTRRLFPKAEWVKVYLQADPEVANDTAIIFDVRVEDLEYPKTRAAHQAWNDELRRLCPAHLKHLICLLLDLA